VNLQRIEHSFPCYYDLLWLFFNRQRPDERRNFLSGFPLRELRQTLLTGPDAGVNDFQEKLPCSGIEDEYGPVNRLMTKRREA
jgi:hypothetical protein